MSKTNNRHIKSRGKKEDLTKTWLVQVSRIDGLRPFAYVGGFDKYSGFVDYIKEDSQTN